MTKEEKKYSVEEITDLINKKTEKSTKSIITEYNLFGKFLIMTKIKYTDKLP